MSIKAFLDRFLSSEEDLSFHTRFVVFVTVRNLSRHYLSRGDTPDMPGWYFDRRTFLGLAPPRTEVRQRANCHACFASYTAIGVGRSDLRTYFSNLLIAAGNSGPTSPLRQYPFEVYSFTACLSSRTSASQYFS